MNKPWSWLLLILSCVGIVCAEVRGAKAEFPEQPVRLIVGFAPGGGTDVLARLVGQKLTEKWGQPVVVENRPGADGIVAQGILATSKPDGYTIGMVLPNHAIAPSVQKLDYDPVNSFATVTLLGTAPEVLIVHPSFPARTLKELIALARENPGKYNYASAGSIDMTHLAMALLMKRAGINIINVPYKGSGPMMVGLLSGEVEMMFVATTSAVEQVKAGKVRALAVDSSTRSPVMPDVPTVAEAADLPDFESGNWYGIMAPAGTPKEIITKMNKDIVEVLKLPETEKVLLNRGVTVVGNSPEEFSDFFVKEMEKWASLLKGSEVQ